MSKILCLNSGGFDSVVLVHYLDDNYALENKIETLFFDYKQPNVALEKEKALKASNKFNFPFNIIKLPLFHWNKTHYYKIEKEVNSNIELEMRNLIFLSYAISFAKANDFDYIAMATIDVNDYYDGSSQFIEKVNEIAKDVGIEIITPLDDCTKYMLKDYVYQFDIKEDEFYSCEYTQNGVPCGECEKCTGIKEIYEELNKPNLLRTYLKEVNLNVTNNNFKSSFMQGKINIVEFNNTDLHNKELKGVSYNKFLNDIKLMNVPNIIFKGVKNDYLLDKIQKAKETLPNIILDVDNKFNKYEFLDYCDEINYNTKEFNIDEVTRLKEISLKSNEKPINILFTLTQKNYITTNIQLREFLKEVKNIKNIKVLVSDVYEKEHFSYTQLVDVYSNLDKLSKEIENTLDTHIQLDLSLKYTYDILEDIVPENVLQEELRSLGKFGNTFVRDNFELIPHFYIDRFEDSFMVLSDGSIIASDKELYLNFDIKLSVGNYLDFKKLSDIVMLGRIQTLEWGKYMEEVYEGYFGDILYDIIENRIKI